MYFFLINTKSPPQDQRSENRKSAIVELKGMLVMMDMFFFSCWALSLILFYFFAPEQHEASEPPQSAFQENQPKCWGGRAPACAAEEEESDGG